MRKYLAAGIIALMIFTSCATVEKIISTEQSQNENSQSPSTVKPSYDLILKDYFVKKGDCLWNISKSQLANPFLWPLIYKTNRDQISNPELIEIDMKLTVIKNPYESDANSAIEAAKKYELP